VNEFGFELTLCATLESPDRVVARQLGAAVHGRRIVDVVVVEPGPEFDRRAAITPETIPPRAIESDVGPGRARRVTDAFDCHPERARAVANRAVEVGFFERDRDGIGGPAVRQAVRYPDWFDRLVAVENKPDLDRPGDLADQLRTDVSLGVFDEVVLATATHVTGAHRNRLSPEVGVWEFDPATGDREVVREATPLSPGEPGVELLDRDATRAEVRPVTATEKARLRRAIAERAYGKGWRTYDLPACAECSPGDRGLPRCEWKGRVVRPVEECGPDCGGHETADPPDVDADALRAARNAWEPDPEGVATRQAGLDQF